jgi:hypothetical protein
MLNSSTADDESNVPSLQEAQIEVLYNRIEIILKKYYINIVLVIALQTLITSLTQKYL